MRAVVYNYFGDPAEVLHVAELPKPEPGPGEIRVKMTVSPIHNHDLATIRGIYGVKPPLPAIGGTEAAGIVEALGEGATALAVGQRVTVARVTGAWAEYFVAQTKRALPLPDSINDQVGCQLSAMPLSALMALEDLGVKSGEWMIQNAATGAVGKTLAMFAKTRGIHVISLVRRDAGVAELAAIGVGPAISTADVAWRQKVAAATGGAPIVAALDSVGGEESGQLLRLLGEGGLLMMFGAMANQPMILNPGDIIFKQATVKGFWGSKRSAITSREDTARMIAEIIRLAASGALKLPVDSLFAFENAAAAALASVQPGRTGKIAFSG